MKKIPRTWTVEIPSVRDRQLLFLARSYGYKGKNIETAIKILEEKGYQLIPW